MKHIAIQWIAAAAFTAAFLFLGAVLDGAWEAL